MRAVLLVALCLVVGCKEKGPTKAELIQELAYEEKEIEKRTEELRFLESTIPILESRLKRLEGLPAEEKNTKANEINELKTDTKKGREEAKNIRNEIDERTQKTHKLQARIDAAP